jgi:hypothetical protein
MNTTLRALAAALALTAAAATQEQPTSAPTSQPTAAWVDVQPWPVEGCIVSGEELKAGKAKTFEVDGRTFKTCCGRCKGKVEKDPAKYVAKLDAAIVEAQAAKYPLATCPISGKKVGAKSKSIVVDGTLVKLCCGGCTEKAHKYAGDIVPKIKAAARERQLAAYPLATCPVSGDEIDPEDATDVMYGTTLVRLCCEHCLEDFENDPGAYVAALTKAEDAGADDDGAHGDEKGKSRDGKDAEHRQGH